MGNPLIIALSYGKSLRPLGRAKTWSDFKKFFLLAYFFIKTHGKINNNSDFLKMSKIWTGLVYIPGRQSA